METVERVRQIIAPLVQEQGLDLYDLEFAGGALRITVDRAGGVDIDAIGRVTRVISRALDEADPITSEYTLEVSSPGLERALRTEDHFARSVGETVAIKTRPGVEGDRRVTGRLIAVADGQVTVQPDDAVDPDARRMLAIGDIERARTVFSWGPAPRPGGPKGRAGTPSPKKKAARS